MIWRTRNLRKEKMCKSSFKTFDWSSEIRLNERNSHTKIRWRRDHLYVEIRTSISACKVIENRAFDLHTLLRTYQILKMFKVLPHRKRGPPSLGTCKYESHVRIMAPYNKSVIMRSTLYNSKLALIRHSSGDHFWGPPSPAKVLTD